MPSPRAAATTPPLVLLVDRDPDTRTMYAEHLARVGWHIEQAEDGRDALAKAISHRPAVIVTETRLPFIDGFDLCRFLRGGADTATMPIIIVTGDGYPPHVARAQQAGAEVVLVKPCLPERLEIEIRKVVGNGHGNGHGNGAATDERNDGAVGSSVNGDAGSVRPATAERSLVRAHRRHETTTPPLAPPKLTCPTCDRPLSYSRSHIGGVSQRHAEQWDYFVCPGPCGTFQYRHRTRKLRPA